MTTQLITIQSQGSSLNSQNINISNYKDIINNIPSTLSFTYNTNNNNINNNINNNQIGLNNQIYIGTSNNYRQIGVPNSSKIIPLKPGIKRSIFPQPNPSKNNYLGQVNIITEREYLIIIKIEFLLILITILIIVNQIKNMEIICIMLLIFILLMVIIMKV